MKSVHEIIAYLLAVVLKIKVPCCNTTALRTMTPALHWKHNQKDASAMFVPLLGTDKPSTPRTTDLEPGALAGCRRLKLQVSKENVRKATLNGG